MQDIQDLLEFNSAKFCSKKINIFNGTIYSSFDNLFYDIPILTLLVTGDPFSCFFRQSLSLDVEGKTENVLEYQRLDNEMNSLL